MGGLENAGSLLKEKKKVSLKEFKNLMFELFEMTKDNKPIEGGTSWANSQIFTLWVDFLFVSKYFLFDDDLLA